MNFTEGVPMTADIYKWVQCHDFQTPDVFFMLEVLKFLAQI
jgi:hypothetical protein